jgi:hypothetical protein
MNSFDFKTETVKRKSDGRRLIDKNKIQRHSFGELCFMQQYRSFLLLILTSQQQEASVPTLRQIPEMANGSCVFFALSKLDEVGKVIV